MHDDRLFGQMCSLFMALTVSSFFGRKKFGEKFKGGPGKIRIRGGGALTPIDTMTPTRFLESSVGFPRW